MNASIHRKQFCMALNSIYMFKAEDAETTNTFTKHLPCRHICGLGCLFHLTNILEQYT